jgi:hypothetical protein
VTSLRSALETPSAVRPPRSKWFWLTAWEIPVLILLGGGLRYWSVTRPVTEPASLGLRLDEPKAGRLRIAWNPAAEPVRTAAVGNIDILDGIARQHFVLTQAMIAAGSYTYLRATNAVEVRMKVTDNSGNQVEDASGFLGQPLAAPVDPSELKELQQSEAQLEAEVRRREKENQAQSARIQTLDRALRTVESRLGIAQRK